MEGIIIDDGARVPLTLSQQAIRRMPYYLKYLKNLGASSDGYISASTIATELRFYEGLVRKDLAFVSSISGKPRVGFRISDLIDDIEHFLGYDIPNRAILVGAGHLGKALMCYKGFDDYGLEIVAAFDSDKKLSGKEAGGKTIFHVSKLENLCGRLNARIGIITVPAYAAQGVCDMLVSGGVMAVWNFAPVQLNVPGGILIQNENMAESLAILSNHLMERR
ncbi:MAG: redox-sensing transcriptional repressor Rex [Synergistaceae bacterium]|jgi:redox-sensing transcriptional repressor|nr:redox-sensing transcriptional repressor Rex [Synergistaceae bacterium]